MILFYLYLKSKECTVQSANMCALLKQPRENPVLIFPHFPTTIFCWKQVMVFTDLLLFVTDIISSYLHYGSRFTLVIIIISEHLYQATLSHSSWIENTSYFEDSSVPALLALNREGLVLQEQETKIRWGQEGITAFSFYQSSDILYPQ